MKYSISLILLSIVLGVNAAVAPLPLPHGGSSHLKDVRNATRVHTVKNKHQAGHSSGSRARNGTSNILHQHPASSVDFYANHAASTSVAHHRAQSTVTVTKSFLFGRSSSHIRNNKFRNMKAAGGMHGEIDSATRTVSGSSNAPIKTPTQTTIAKRSPLNAAPTPAPTASGSPMTTVHINDEKDFALLLPKNRGELISDAEADGISYCRSTGCANTLPEGFITAAAVTRAPDGVSWIQVTGCIDPSKSSLSSTDDGGQFDVRFPNGAQCTFGGYGASFIEQVEPSANRFCLRCCAKENDQANCNSHQDRSGCLLAIPGNYDFPKLGVSCG